MSNLWVIDSKSESHWLNLQDADFVENGAYPKWSAAIDWQGCVRIYRENEPDATEYDTLHICELDDFIKRLQEIQQLAREHFKNHEYGAWKQE